MVLGYVIFFRFLVVRYFIDDLYMCVCFFCDLTLKKFVILLARDFLMRGNIRI